MATRFASTFLSIEALTVMAIKNLLVPLFIFLTFFNIRIVLAEVSVGSGPGYLVIFDSQHREERVISGIDESSLCATTPEGDIYLVNAGGRTILRLDGSGQLLGEISINDQIIYLRTNAKGELLVTTPTGVSLYAPSGEKLRTLQLPNVFEADFLNDALVINFKDKERALQVVQWDKQIVRESHLNNLHGVRSLAVSPEGSISVWDGTAQLILRPTFEVVQRILAPEINKNRHTDFGSTGKLLIISADSPKYALLDTAGNKEIFSSQLMPTCGAFLNDGGYFISFVKHKERTNSLGKARYHQYFENKPRLTVSSLAGVCGLVLAASILLSIALRRRTISAQVRSSSASVATNSQRGLEPLLTSSKSDGSKRSFSYSLFVFLGGVAFFVLTYMEIQSIILTTKDASYLKLCIFGWGAALMVLTFGRSIGTKDDYYYLRNSHDDKGNRIVWSLLVLSFLTCISCLTCKYFSGEGKHVVALWIASQVFFLMSLIKPPNIGNRVSSSLACLAGGVLIIAVVLRFWKLGEYPHGIHHDHGQFGHSVLTFLYGDWKPFFAPDRHTNTYMRPWTAPTAAFFYIFGISQATLRLSNAVWGVALVIACYLLGTALATRRLGIVFAALVSVQHSILVYTRQPYVVESTAPFVFSVYCFVRAIRYGRWSAWAWAGAWAGYAMLSIRQCTTFPFIWLSIFLGFLLFAPKLMWRNRVGISLLVVGSAVVYLPFLNFSTSSGAEVMIERLRIESPLIDNNFSLVTDIKVWQSQFGKSFGSIFLLPDKSPWGLSTRGAILGSVGATCFFMGLGLMFLTKSIPVLVLGLLPPIISIAVGSAMLNAPPSYYHMFVGIVFVLLPVAIFIEKIWGIGVAAKSRYLRICLYTVAFTLTSFVFKENFRELYASLKLPQAAKELDGPWANNSNSVIAQHVLRHRDSKFFIVRKHPYSFSASFADFFFYGFHSNVFDLDYNLMEYLPFAPIEERYGVFFVLPERAEDIALLKRVFPNGAWSKLYYGNTPSVVHVLTVLAADIEKGPNVIPPAQNFRFSDRFEIKRISQGG